MFPNACWCPRLVPKKNSHMPRIGTSSCLAKPQHGPHLRRLRSLVRGELRAVARWWVELVVLFESKRHSFSSIGWRCSLKFLVNQLSRHHWAQQLVWGYLGSRGFTNCFQALEVMEKKRDREMNGSQDKSRYYQVQHTACNTVPARGQTPPAWSSEWYRSSSHLWSWPPGFAVLFRVSLRGITCAKLTIPELHVQRKAWESSLVKIMAATSFQNLSGNPLSPAGGNKIIQ